MQKPLYFEHNAHVLNTIIGTVERRYLLNEEVEMNIEAKCHEDYYLDLL